MADNTLAWLTVGCLLMLLELVVPGGVLGFLGLATLITGGLVHFGFLTGIVDTAVAWMVISTISVLVLRSFSLKLMPGDSKVHDVDEANDVIGVIVEVIEEIEPSQSGRVSFKDAGWQAESNHHLKTGEKAVIVWQKGNCLGVKPLT